ncbi:hypothetical protein PXK01_18995 [Phaeobacter sp. PT47_59]|uniref:hypothetical protein n=1 Tax=Phaeobacter sp. PT47_59 TaxID=3029979 RepID=UPI002380C045|nr:hypothetical protein [Phaeobacter sp. PT47_59]MDE4176247.1 hypothetical protein [Phaeobacter sp. PT47_59]
METRPIENFFETDAGQHASKAKQYLEGSLVLDAAQREKGKILFLPTLALAGHGLELMLKACILWNNGTVETKGRNGHKIVTMWNKSECTPVRCQMRSIAIRVADLDRQSGLYSDVPKTEEIPDLIDDHVTALGGLHGQKDYPLRYPSNPNQKGPCTPLLVRTLWETADTFVKRPSEFLLVGCSQ